ncbi:hypothetical protein, partial [Mesorhizobium sp. M2D.F.Ca.ET.153.01.1.1]|uniref:hypothetical protein n=1 Tax=Mesorhizobium sp. M2D.F.Ca.ET.153.01.1.1 TaxID=2500520 RepID=UPI001AEE87B3
VLVHQNMHQRPRFPFGSKQQPHVPAIMRIVEPMMAFEPGELRQLLEDEPASPPMMAFESGDLRQLLDDEPAPPPMMAFEPGELRQLLEDEPASPPMIAFEP